MTLICQQYEIAFSREGEDEVLTINYGVLDRILVCSMGNESVWGNLRGTTHLLAVITPWRTNGQDAALETVFFKHTLVPIVTDLRNVCAVVGRVESRGEWGIVDRYIGMAHATFTLDQDRFLGAVADSDDSDDSDA
jgi:hypothetical protein